MVRSEQLDNHSGRAAEKDKNPSFSISADTPYTLLQETSKFTNFASISEVQSQLLSLVLIEIFLLEWQVSQTLKLLLQMAMFYS